MILPKLVRKFVISVDKLYECFEYIMGTYPGTLRKSIFHHLFLPEKKAGALIDEIFARVTLLS